MKTILILILLVLVFTSCRPLLVYQEEIPADSASYHLFTEKVRRVIKVRDYYVVITNKGNRLQEFKPYDSATISFYYRGPSHHLKKLRKPVAKADK